MSFGAAHQPAWIYWYGRALAAQGEEMGSRAYFLRIAGQTDFYGLLAAEELGYVLALPDITTCRPRRMSPRLRPIRVSSARSS